MDCKQPAWRERERLIIATGIHARNKGSYSRHKEERFRKYVREIIIGSQGTLWPQNEKVLGAKQCSNTVPWPLITSTLLAPMLVSVANVTQYLVSFSLVRAHDTPGLTAFPMALGGTTNPWVSCKGSLGLLCGVVHPSLCAGLISPHHYQPSGFQFNSFSFLLGHHSRTQSGRGSYSFKLSLQLTYLTLL